MIAKAYTGRTPKPWYLKLFIPWWFGNSYEPTAPDWYLPDRPWLWRQFCWYCRNPLVNFQDFVIGVNDRNYVAYGQEWPAAVPAEQRLGNPIDITDWHDVRDANGRPFIGWKFGVLCVARVIWLPYVSYSGTRVLWHIGWYSYGRFQIKFNLLNR